MDSGGEQCHNGGTQKIWDGGTDLDKNGSPVHPYLIALIGNVIFHFWGKVVFQLVFILPVLFLLTTTN